MNATSSAVNPLDRVELVMGMPIGIDVRDPDIDPGILDAAFDWFRWVDATFSTYKSDSEITRINRGELDLADAHPDVRAVLQRCEHLRFETGGYFDIRAAQLPVDLGPDAIPPAAGPVEPSGLVKGWSVDRAAKMLEAAGVRNFCINAGGDIWVSGGALPEPAWRIGIQHPRIRDRVAAVVVGSHLGIATSGAYTRGEHIVDPYTGASPSDVLSVTIVGPEVATADAYATSAFAMGGAGPEWTRVLTALGYEAMTIMADDTVLSTPGFPRAS